MFRFLFGGPRTVRVPIDRSNIEVQQVKVTRTPRPIVAQFILACLITTIVVQGVKRWDPLGTHAQRDVLQEDFEKAKKRMADRGNPFGKDWDKHIEQRSKDRLIRAEQLTSPSPYSPNSETIRLTVPIWLRQIPGRPYNSNDPEWKEYIKLQNDTRRMNQIRKQIGESVVHQVNHTKYNDVELKIIKFNGKVSVALEFVPQLLTPPVYQVPCLWLSTSTVSAGWRPLASQTGARMERVFRPVVLFEATSAAMRTFIRVTYFLTKAKVMTALGKDSSKPTTLPPAGPSSNHQQADNDTNVESSKSAQPIFPLFPDLGDSDSIKKMHADVVSSMPYSDAIQHAVVAFNRVRSSRQKLAVARNVRGLCQFRGFVTFFGERGRFRVEIVAHYLPSEEVFIGAMSVKQAYVVQDYVAWEKLLEKQRKEIEQKTAEKNTTTTADAPKPHEGPPSAPPSDGENTEKK